ncbi:hypothetical protein REPUB_Repub03eG0258800 [Reevesia pubescens]
MDDLIFDILSFLPVKTLLRLRCLCKSHCKDIDSTPFIKAHIDRSFQAKTNVKPKDFYAPGLGIRVSGSCNGLLSLSRFPYQISIWNPSIRRYKELPVCPETGGFYSHFCNFLGFGYDPSSNDYKVFVKAIPSVPPSCSNEHYNLSLQVLGGRLVLCKRFKNARVVELSHIVKYGQHFAWTKLYNLNFTCSDPQAKDLFLDRLVNVKVLERSKDGNKILLQTNNRVFLWYDLKQETFRRSDIEFYFQQADASFCWESLVSPGADSLTPVSIWWE